LRHATRSRAGRFPALSVEEINDMTTATKPQFRTICRVGYGLHVDAMWNAGKNPDGSTSHYIYFQLVDGYDQQVRVGSIILTADHTGHVVTDEDGQDFPDLETAVRHHAKVYLKLDWRWADWQPFQPEHESKVNGELTVAAFTAHDIDFAVQMAAEEPEAA
jgi:hypothetical protein